MTTPDKWLLIKVKAKDLYKVFGVWSGGYLDGDSWRCNSGIESMEIDGDYFLFHGRSGSVYRCHKDMYGTTSYGASILGSANPEVEILDGIEDFPMFNERV